MMVGVLFFMVLKSMYVQIPKAKRVPEFSHVVVWTTNPLVYELAGDGDTMTSANIHRAFANANYYSVHEDYNTRLFDILVGTPGIHVIRNGSMKRSGPTVTKHVWRLHLKPVPSDWVGSTSMEYAESYESAISTSEELKNCGIETVKIDEADVRRFPYTVHCDICNKDHEFTHEVEPKKFDTNSSSVIR